ncbi:MAG: sms, partial [Betaproteobacteria bacterium]|nr:sms [Betaproteobacteria bacterium]
MAKSKSLYACTECGGQALKWQGQCPHCQAWNTLEETLAEAAPSANRFALITDGGRLQRL